MTQPPSPDQSPDVRNSIENSTATGPVFQAGSVQGGLHYYNVTTPAPQPTAYVVHPGPVRQPSRVWPHIGRWFVALLPLLICSTAIAAAADAVAAGTNIAVRRLIDVAILVLGGTVIVFWSGVSGRRVVHLLHHVLGKATPSTLIALSTNALAVLTGCASALWLFGFTTELFADPGDPRSRGANGALVFLAFFAVLTGRLIALRKRGLNSQVGSAQTR
ncbi:hypothetical protein GCM10022267_52450 [Lentzea roselyniae]|uniref:Uncharacterized protein n=1 Tax=Lentzea roselyniae TaxID=531940 RepID=A0ABP7BHY8_9PSEU